MLVLYNGKPEVTVRTAKSGKTYAQFSYLTDGTAFVGTVFGDKRIKAISDGGIVQIVVSRNRFGQPTIYTNVLDVNGNLVPNEFSE